MAWRVHLHVIWVGTPLLGLGPRYFSNRSQPESGNGNRKSPVPDSGITAGVPVRHPEILALLLLTRCLALASGFVVKP